MACLAAHSVGNLCVAIDIDDDNTDDGDGWLVIRNFRLSVVQLSVCDQSWEWPARTHVATSFLRNVITGMSQG